MKTITVTLEVYDHTTIEEIEKSIDKALNDSGIECTYNVEEQESSKEEKTVLQESVKDWFVKTYPADSLGAELHSKLSFEQFYEGMKEEKDVYEMLGVRDSFVRECVFGELGKRLGVESDEIYNLWMDGPTGNIALGNGKKPKIEILISGAKDKSSKSVTKESGKGTELLGDSLDFR